MRTLIEDGTNDVLFSAASIWEIAIKAGLGRADFQVRPDAITRAARDTGFTELPVHAATAALVANLPIDRVLVAQAITGTLRLYTADTQLLPYSELVNLVR